jgi:hypothetical protein
VGVPARHQPQQTFRTERVEVDATASKQADGKRSKPVDVRNGLPIARPYRWREPRARFAIEALRRAAAEYGDPPVQPDTTKRRKPRRRDAEPPSERPESDDEDRDQAATS